LNFSKIDIDEVIDEMSAFGRFPFLTFLLVELRMSSDSSELFDEVSIGVVVTIGVIWV